MPPPQPLSWLASRLHDHLRLKHSPVPAPIRWRVGVLVLVNVILLEGLARLALVVMAARGIRTEPIELRRLRPAEARFARMIAEDRNPVYMVDSLLGWAPRPNTISRRYRTIADGLRSPVAASAVAAFGDSFTWGAEVADTETWAARIGARNFGVPGYGLDQAYLRYLRDGRPTRPRVVLIGFMTEDIQRQVYVYRPFYTVDDGLTFAKPRFVLTEDTLVLRRNPLPHPADYQALLQEPSATLARLARDDFFAQHLSHAGALDASAAVRLTEAAIDGLRMPDPYTPTDERFRITVALFDAFARAVRADGAQPVILLFPTIYDLQRPPAYLGLRDTLVARGHRVLDLRDAFTCGRCLDHFAPRGHYSAQGNGRVAAYLERALAGP